MTDLLDRPIRDALAVFLDSAPPTPAHPVATELSVGASRRHGVLTVAVAGTLAAGLVGVVVLRDDGDARPTSVTGADTPDDSTPASIPVSPESTQPPPRTDPVDTSDTGSSAPETTANVTSPSVEAVVPALFDAAPTELRWTALDDASSIGRSQVGGIASGAAGFVAVGQGYDDGTNQGRVWFSPDGLSWEEPTFEIFDAQVVQSVVATDDAYFVLAGQNPDRIPGHREGDAISMVAHVYRSIDGRSWVDLGPATSVNLFGVGELLLGMVLHSDITTDEHGESTAEVGYEVSTDALNWTPATFDPPMPPMSILGRTDRLSDGWLLRTVSPDGPALWSSTDGRAWTSVATQEIASGELVAGDRGLVSIANARSADCPIAQPDVSDAESAAAWRRRQWTCTNAASVSIAREDDVDWEQVVTDGLPRSPLWQRPIVVGHQFVLPVLRSDGRLTVSTSVDASTWTDVDDLEIDLTAGDGSGWGSPQPLISSASDTTAVIAIGTRNPEAPTGSGTTLIIATAE